MSNSIKSICSFNNKWKKNWITHTQSQKEKNWSIIKINFRATTIHNIRTFKKKENHIRPIYLNWQ